MSAKRIVRRAWQAHRAGDHRNGRGVWLLVEEPALPGWTVDSVFITASGAMSRVVSARSTERASAEATFENTRLDHICSGWSPSERLDPAVAERVGADEQIVIDTLIAVAPPTPLLRFIDDVDAEPISGQSRLALPPQGERLLAIVGPDGTSVLEYGRSARAAMREARGVLMDGLRIGDEPPHMVFDALWCPGRLVLLDLLGYDGDLRGQPFALRHRLLTQVLAEEFFADSGVSMLSPDPQGALLVDVAARYGVGQMCVV